MRNLSLVLSFVATLFALPDICFAQSGFTPTSFFKKIENQAIRGHNDRASVRGSVIDCKRQCVAETAFVCRSIDYNKQAGTCDLSSMTAARGGQWVKSGKYDHYERRIEGSQSFANAYAHFDTNKPQNSKVWNIDQQIWIERPANAYQWVITWTWVRDKQHGGYFGFNQSAKGQQQVLFSIWNALDCREGKRGSRCLGFTGEGSGKSVRMPFTIRNDKYYRLRIWRLDADNTGQWWGAWLIEHDSAGRLVEHHIGNLKAERQFDDINANSINDFVEFFGSPVADCRSIGRSTAGFTPPALNYQGKGTGVYEYTMHRTPSNVHPDNLCYPDRTSAGVNITTREFDFGFSKGTMIQLGGADKQHAPLRTRVPNAMPDS